jgi:hypothetical protein
LSVRIHAARDYTSVLAGNTVLQGSGGLACNRCSNSPAHEVKLVPGTRSHTRCARAVCAHLLHVGACECVVQHLTQVPQHNCGTTQGAEQILPSLRVHMRTVCSCSITSW